MVVNMEIGMITPPVGLNLFVTSSVADMSVLACGEGVTSVARHSVRLPDPCNLHPGTLDVPADIAYGTGDHHPLGRKP